MTGMRNRGFEAGTHILITTLIVTIIPYFA